MSFSCDHCTRQRKSCVLSNKSDKCNECVHSKKSCLLFSDFLIMNVMQLFKTHEKIEKEQTALSDEKQYLFEAFQAAETKKCQLHHHAQFLYDCDDRLIQEKAEIFKEELHVLKRKQDFIISSDNNFSDLLIFEINMNTIFFTLFDDF